MNLAQTILDILADVAGTDDVRTDPSLELYRRRMLDSLQTVELIVRLSATLCIAISPAEFDREAWATPAAMVADIERRVREGGDGQANGSTS